MVTMLLVLIGESGDHLLIYIKVVKGQISLVHVAFKYMLLFSPGGQPLISGGNPACPVLTATHRPPVGGGGGVEPII